MSVAEHLGVDKIDGPALRAARACWKEWTSVEHDLGVVDELVELPAWTVEHHDRSDAVLRALARLGSVHLAGEARAATALAWMLVPGASRLAAELMTRSPEVDVLVASHLWTQCREFDPRASAAVAGQILRQTRRGVQAELCIGEGWRRSDRTWSQSVAIGPSSPEWDLVEATRRAMSLSAESEQWADLMDLLELLRRLRKSGVLTSEDQRLLVELSVAADDLELAGIRSRDSGTGGLSSMAVLAVVATDRGVCERTIARQLRRCLDRIAVYAEAQGLSRFGAGDTVLRGDAA